MTMSTLLTGACTIAGAAALLSPLAVHAQTAEPVAFNMNTNSSSDYEAVVAAVDEYVSGLRSGSIDELRGAFHPDAIMYGFTPDGLLGGSIDNLYTFVEQYGDAPEIATRLDVLGITPTTAVVRVTMENDAAGDDYTDFHSLLKQDGEWVVVAKLFHRYEQ